MSRFATLLVSGAMLFVAVNLACPVQAQFLPHFETPIEQAVARVSGENLHVVRVLTKNVYETREEAYPVSVKVAKTVVDAATQQQRTVYEEVTEMRTRKVTVQRPVYEQTMTMYDIGAVTMHELGGAKLDAAALKTRIAKQSLILIATTGAAVPEPFTLLFKPETIVLDLSKPMALAPPPPPPPGGVPAPAGPVEAADDLPKMADIPPHFRLASIDADERFVLKAVARQARAITSYASKTEQRLVDGKEVATTVYVPLTVTEQRESISTTTYPPSLVSGVTVDQQPLSDRHRAALKSREIPVVISPNGKPVESFWLQNIKPNMLVLTTPSGQAPPPDPVSVPMPVPVPVPPAPVLP